MTHRVGVLACSAALLALTAAAPARAQIDLTGTFDVSFDFLGDFCTATVNQTGSAIDIFLECVFMQAGAIGTIDTMTGVFSVTGGCVVGPLVGIQTTNGVASGDSSSFSGGFSCPPAVPGGPYAFTATRPTTPTPACPASPTAGCRAAGKSLLVLKDSDNDSSDKLTWKWLKGDATTLEDFGVPTGTSNYTLCIYAGTAAQTIMEVEVPADAMKWQPISDKGWKYKDQAGVTRMLLKSGAAGKSKVLVKGKGEALPNLSIGTLPVEPNEFPVSVQLLRNGTALCWESTFAESGVKKNAETLFKAKSP